MRSQTIVVVHSLLAMVYLMACNSEPSRSNEIPKAEKNYEEFGQQHALATKATLGKNLVTHIKANGTEGALQFCSTKAIHLTDSMAQQQGVGIKRVSDQPRNPGNRASEEEMAYIKAQKERLINGEGITPFTFEKGDKMMGYYPIMTNAMCLQCHGSVGSEVTAITSAKLAELYPNDEATGYSMDQLRGIWVVEMDK